MATSAEFEARLKTCRSRILDLRYRTTIRDGWLECGKEVNAVSVQSVLHLESEWSDGFDAEKPDADLHSREPLDALVAMERTCAGISVSDMTVQECIAAIERMSTMQARLAGLKSATLARIGELQRPNDDEEADPVPLGLVKLPGTHRTVFELVEKGGGQSRETSRREIQRAEAIAGPFPLFGRAIQEGRISAEYLDVLTRYVREAELQEKASQCEAELLDRALREPLPMFTKSVRAWIVKNGPVVAERKARIESRKERLSVYREDDGFAVRGWLTSMNGLVLDRALRAMIGVPSREDARSSDQRQAQALIDLVSAGIVGAGKEGEVLGGAAGLDALPGAGSGPNGTGGRPNGNRSGSAVMPPRFQISVHVPLDTLVQTQRAIERGCKSLEILDPQGAEGSDVGPVRGLGEDHRSIESHCEDAECYEIGAGLGAGGSCLHGRAEVTQQLGRVLATIKAGTDLQMLDGFESAAFDEGTPLVPSKLAQLMCDSSIVRVVLSARGEPLDASHAQRLFSLTQTRAVHARDRTCRFPGCDRGVEMSEIHHAQEWGRKGKTVVDNAVLICFHHHEVVHREEITIAHHAGGFVFKRPSGKVIGVRMHQSRNG